MTTSLRPWISLLRWSNCCFAWWCHSESSLKVSADVQMDVGCFNEFLCLLFAYMSIWVFFFLLRGTILQRPGLFLSLLTSELAEMGSPCFSVFPGQSHHLLCPGLPAACKWITKLDAIHRTGHEKILCFFFLHTSYNKKMELRKAGNCWEKLTLAPT